MARSSRMASATTWPSTVMPSSLGSSRDSLPWRLVVRRQESAKAAEAPKRACLDRSQRNSQLSGDLGLGAVAEVGQPQYLALLVRQAAERMADLARPHVPLGQLSAVLADHAVQLVDWDRRAAPPAEVIDRPVVGDTQHPRLQTSGGVIAIPVAPDLVEDPLQNVFGLVVGHEPSEVAKHHRAERSVDVVDRTVLAGSVPRSEAGGGALHCRFFRRFPRGPLAP